MYKFIQEGEGCVIGAPSTQTNQGDWIWEISEDCLAEDLGAITRE